MTKIDKDIKHSVMDKIDKGEIRMHSKMYFWALSILLVASTTIFVVASAIMFSLARRDILVGRNLGLHEFGPKGQSEFISSMPWLILIFGIIAVIAALLLVRKFEFSYRHGFYTVLAVVLVSVISLSLLASATGFDERAGRLPPLKPLQTFSRYAENRRLAGRVIEIDNSYRHALVADSSNHEVSLEWNDTTRFMHDDNIELGDEIVAFGEYRGDTFIAFGIDINPMQRGGVNGMLKRHEINMPGPTY